jgi:virginiamycin A acetyltransferase
MYRIHSSAVVSPLAHIEESKRGTPLEIGERVMIDAFVKIKMAGGSGAIRIGDDSYINSGCVLYSGNGITIGRHVLIAANCTLAPANHEFADKDRLIIEQRFQPSRGGIVIGDDGWLGAGCVVVDGAVIPDGVVIGAMSLVRGRLEPYGIYAGVPAILKGHRTARSASPG